jgi:sugar phosphate permease
MHGCNFLLISCMPGRFASYRKAATTSGFSNACTYVGAAISMYGIPSDAEAFGWRATVGSWFIVAALGLAASLIAVGAYTAFIKRTGTK